MGWVGVGVGRGWGGAGLVWDRGGLGRGGAEQGWGGVMG